MAQQRLAQISGHLNYPQGMLAGQTAIITGSGQGIGAEAARLFANEGAKVVVQDIDAGMPPRSSLHGSSSIGNTAFRYLASPLQSFPATKLQKQRS